MQTMKRVLVMVAAVGLSLPANSSIAAIDGQAAGAQSGGPSVWDSTIVVVGNGRVDVAPDRAVVSTGVMVQEATAEAAMRACAEGMTRLMDVITRQGIPKERVQTSNVNLSPVYEQRKYEEGRAPKIVGYQATNTVRIQIDDMNKVGTVLDAAVKAGANQSFGIGFELKDDSAQKREGLTRAVTAANLKAQTIAAALGVTLGAIVEVTESGAVTQPPVPRMMAARGFAGDASTPISAGEVGVEATVTIRYAISKK